MSDRGPSSLSVAPWRRAVALATLVPIAVLLIRQAVGLPVVGQALCLALAVTFAWAATTLWRARANALVWDGEGLRDRFDTLRIPRATIVAVDTGAISLRPSQGFTLHLDRPVPRGWSPGLWWSLGRTVGVGGLTDRRETRALAQRIADEIAPRP